MSIPYRTQQNIKRFTIAALILLVVGVLVWGMWTLWLQRFVVYSRTEGAVLNFDLPEQVAAGEAAVPPKAETPIEIYYNEGDDKVELSTEITQLKGYFFERKQVYSKPDEVWEKIQALPAGTAVLMDMKNIKGSFYYSTDTGRPVSDTADVEGVDLLLENLAGSDYYAIARVPALRDRSFGLKYTKYGLPTSGGYLWMDDEGCYWLNPAKDGTMSYLIQTVTELRQLGFSEVVLDDFRFPNTDKISFSGDRQQTLIDAAEKLVNTCATDTFCVSFVRSKPDLNLPEGHSRIYLEDVSVLDTLSLAEQSGFEDPSVRLVFLTDSGDTRFDEYCVLRPLDMAGA